MNDRSLPDKLAPVVVAALLTLTALGNAKLLFVLSAMGLLAWLIVFPKDFLRREALPTTVGALVAAVIAFVMLIR